MKKSSLKTTTTYDEPNHGTKNSRVSKTSVGTGKTYDSSDWQLNADGHQGAGTKNNRYATSKPNGSQPQGLQQPLKTNAPMKNDTDSIGPGVLTKSTPARKRSA